ncbi:MAG TPA: zf-TFIIB domain-containing protein [Gemmataceae bacterium]|nr:zf-TFIIB domain-containing protein [Gemmataceae bacterium]
MNLCPRCKIPLLTEHHGEIVMTCCEHCGGHWMDPEDLRAVLDLIRLPVHGRAVRMGVDLTDVREDAACPYCGVPMEPFNYAGDSGIILDKCRRCGGLWLDSGDLERVLAVVAASEQDLDRDVKRFSADLHHEEVRQDAMEQKDGSPVADPLGSILASRIADKDTRP